MKRPKNGIQKGHRLSPDYSPTPEQEVELQLYDVYEIDSLLGKKEEFMETAQI